VVLSRTVSGSLGVVFDTSAMAGPTAEVQGCEDYVCMRKGLGGKRIEEIGIGG
jgi:hypothetical protein